MGIGTNFLAEPVATTRIGPEADGCLTAVFVSRGVRQRWATADGSCRRFTRCSLCLEATNPSRGDSAGQFRRSDVQAGLWAEDPLPDLIRMQPNLYIIQIRHHNFRQPAGTWSDSVHALILSLINLNDRSQRSCCKFSWMKWMESGCGTDQPLGTITTTSTVSIPTVTL